MQYSILSLLAGVCYFTATLILYRGLQHNDQAKQSWAWRLMVLGGLAHGAALILAIWGSGAPDVNWLRTLSGCSFIMLALIAAARLNHRPLFDAALVALPIAALIVLADATGVVAAVPLASAGPATQVHVFSSLLAFGILAIAAIYAMLIALLDHFLRRHRLNSLVQALPPLEVLESLLLQLVLAGFLLLSVALASGLVFVEDFLAQHLLHKAVLSILAWVVFGVLLLGRWRFGWRGQTAVRLTLAGMALLLLSYFGSKLVLEQILGQNWQV